MKRLEKKISIIIPVYNSEKTIIRCLDSVVSNEYSNKEVIIVDNNSTDNSRNIINKYKKKYDFIKVYKSKSSLLGGVKNLAIKKCTGDYFIFVDSDDYISDKTLEKINNIISKKDYSLIRYNASYTDQSNKNMFITNIEEKEYDNIQYMEMVIDEFIKENKIFGPSWLYAYNKKFFVNNKLIFKNKLQEDYGLTPEIIIESKNIYVMKDILYTYCFNNQGMTNKIDNKMKKAIDVIYHSNNHLKNINKVNKKIRDKYIEYISVTLKRKYDKLNKEEKEIFCKSIERSDYIGKLLKLRDLTYDKINSL